MLNQGGSSQNMFTFQRSHALKKKSITNNVIICNKRSTAIFVPRTISAVYNITTYLLSDFS